jgi:16S rRNA (guanine527-N7)-methyltransferase
LFAAIPPSSQRKSEPEPHQSMAVALTPQEFQAATNVSRETLRRLELYAHLLQTWQKKTNLVSDRSLKDLWRRHFLDSAQLFFHAPPSSRVWVDLGSGAGFPGLVLAIMGARQLHLIEARGKKCLFLREAARITGADVIIHNGRIEGIPAFAADVVVARALRPLNKLIPLAYRFISPDTTCLFLKGKNVVAELTEATKCWNMVVERIPSVSDKDGVVLRITKLRSVKPGAKGL